jgi:hypothetical protein
VKLLLLHPPRSCVGCEHFDTGEADTEISTSCSLAAEPIDDETVAATCPDYTPT